MLARIALLALALFSLLAPTPAQTYRFPANDGEITGYPLIPIWWKGKLALLSMGPWKPGLPHWFVRYDWPRSMPFVPPQSFTLAAVYAQDTRPCAQQGLPTPGAEVFIHNVELVDVLNVGPISPAGWVYWEGSVKVELDFSKWRLLYPGGAKPFMLSYCPAYRTNWTYSCSSACSGWGISMPGPELCALVLTID